MHDDRPRALVDRRRDAEADRADRRRRAARRRPPRAPRAALPASPSGVGRSCRRTTSPSRVTTPARIFVPPRSTPMACVPLTLSGYRNPPDGRLRGEAVPRLPRRPRQGEGPARRERGDEPRRSRGGRTAPAAGSRSASGAGRWRRWTLVALLVARRAARRLGRRRLPLGAQRRLATRTSGCPRDDVGRSRSRTGCISRTPTNILLLGTDHATNGQAGAAPTSTPTR